VGSGAEAENVKLMKSGEEDGRFYTSSKFDEGDVYIAGASLCAVRRMARPKC
jgi:hypothetical protein